MYPHQAQRLTQLLDEGALDAVIATAPENVFYITGFRSLNEAIFRTPQFAVFSRQGTALLVPAIDVATIVLDGIDVTHIVAFGGFRAQASAPLPPETKRVVDIMADRAPSPQDALARALEALGVHGGAIGLDETRIVPTAWQRITARLAAYKVVPAGDRLLTARRVKAPWEIECLSRALRVAEESLNAVIQTLAPGVTEREAVGVLNAEVAKHEATPIPALIAMDSRTAIPLPWPTDRALRRGDLLRMDVGCVFKGYHGTVARMAVMGEPNERQAKAHGAVLAGLQAAIAAVKPGVAARRIHAAAVEAVRAAGIAGYERSHVGHAIGLEPYERPKLSAHIDTALDLGEVLRIETPYYDLGWAGFNVKDTLLVTTAGAKLLNTSARELVTLD